METQAAAGPTTPGQWIRHSGVGGSTWAPLVPVDRKRFLASAILLGDEAPGEGRTGEQQHARVTTPEGRGWEAVAGREDGGEESRRIARRRSLMGDGVWNAGRDGLPVLCISPEGSIARRRILRPAQPHSAPVAAGPSDRALLKAATCRSARVRLPTMCVRTDRRVGDAVSPQPRRDAYKYRRHSRGAAGRSNRHRASGEHLLDCLIDVYSIVHLFICDYLCIFIILWASRFPARIQEQPRMGRGVVT